MNQFNVTQRILHICLLAVDRHDEFHIPLDLWAAPYLNSAVQPFINTLFSLEYNHFNSTKATSQLECREHKQWHMPPFLNLPWLGALW